MVVSDLVPERRERALYFGATEVVDPVAVDVTSDIVPVGTAIRAADAQKLLELINAHRRAKGLAPVLMVGNCMGSNIAATLARREPDLVRGVLAVNPLTEASFRAAWPARVRAEARSSSATALAASPCQTGVRRTSGKIDPQTLSPSIGAKRGEKTRRTYR